MGLTHYYIPSMNIDGFPISKPRQYIDNGTLSTIKRDNRFLFESNFCNLIRSVTDRKSFVVNYFKNSDTGHNFTVVLNGYVFTFNTTSDIFNNSSVYAVVHTSDNGEGGKELSYQDAIIGDNGISYYKSFSLVCAENEDMIKNDVNGKGEFLLIWDINKVTSQPDEDKVPSESKIKFDVNSVKVTVIDGKH